NLCRRLLAGAVRAEQPEHLARLDLEVDAAQGLVRAVRLVAVADRDRRHRLYIYQIHNSLSPTARVILGMLRLGSRTGYDIKQKIEISTRFFWGASYGQIYPELKRLAAAGLVEAAQDPRGGVKRTAYRLTPAGAGVPPEWVHDPGPPLL